MDKVEILLKGAIIPTALEHVFYKGVKYRDSYGGEHEHRAKCDMTEAQVISSEIVFVEPSCGHRECTDPEHNKTKKKMHAPVIDIDMKCGVVESSTPGHHHLYIDAPMTWRQYKRLLKSMMKAGVIEKGYYHAAMSKEATHCRVPWEHK